MHFQCTKADLVQSIALVERAVSTTDTMQVIKGIHLRVTDNNVVLTTTNLELSIRTQAPCHVMQPGSLVLDGKLFAAIVRKLPDETVVIQKKENSDQVEITAGTAEFSIHSLTGEDFPEFPAKEQDELITIPANTLHTFIKNTVFATSQDETRPYLGGVYIELDPTTLRFTATDSNRLSTYMMELEAEHTAEITAIVPGKTMTEVHRSLPQDKKLKVSLHKAKNQLVFTFDHTIIASRLIDGQFPNYRSVIPGEQPITITTNKNNLQAAVDRVSLLDPKGVQPIVLEVTDGVLEVKTPSSDMGFACEQLNVEHTGQNGRAAFSPKYILDMLRACESEQITLEYNSDLRQAVLRPAEGRHHIYVLMPVRI